MERVWVFLQEHWIFCIVSCLVVWVCYKHAWKPYKEISRLGLNGPRFIPIIGSSMFLLSRNHMHLSLVEMNKKYGEVYGMSTFGAVLIFVSDKEMLKEILVKEFRKFNDRKPLVNLQPRHILGNFMSSISGEKWANQRHTLSPAFSATKLKRILALMNESCDTLVNIKLKNVADKKEPIEIHDWLQKISLEFILSSAFGIKTESQQKEDDYLTKLAGEFFKKRNWLRLLIAFPFTRFISELLSDPLNVKEMAEVAQNIIKTRLASNDSQKRQDLLQLMLDSRNEVEGKKLSDDEIIAQCILFLLAGNETSSTTLGFLCHHLVADSHVQDKIQEEIDANWPEDEEIPSYETINKMTYLDMAIQETLRMYPPATMTARHCSESCDIKGVHFPKECRVFVPVYAIHHDPKNYPDPEKFEPERFAPEEKAKRDQFLYLPFGQGPRNCIGMRFAMIAMKIVLVRMLKEFRLEVCSKTQIPMVPYTKTLLSPPKEGIWIQVASRKKLD